MKKHEAKRETGFQASQENVSGSIKLKALTISPRSIACNGTLRVPVQVSYPSQAATSHNYVNLKGQCAIADYKNSSIAIQIVCCYLLIKSE